MSLIGFKKPEIITDVEFRPTRRSFLVGAGATLLMAPAVVRAVSLMNIRGEPLIPAKLLDTIPCDGRIFHEHEDPGLFHLIEDHLEHARAEINRVTGMADIVYPHRRYGGSREFKTFAVPDFTPFKAHFGEQTSFELDRQGRLFIVDPIAGTREEV